MAKSTMEPRSDISTKIDKRMGEDCGMAPEKQGAKAKKDRDRSCSRDMVSNLETFMAKIEIAVVDVQGTVEDISVRIIGDEPGKEELEAEVQELKSGVGELQGEMLGNLTNAIKELQ